MNRTALYLRVSKDNGSQDTANQEAQLRTFAETQGWQVTAVYRDEVSGTKGKESRVAFSRMLTDASQRRFDILLLWAVDRLSRQGPYACLNIIKTLTGYGVRFRSFMQPFLDTTQGFGEVLLALFGWLDSEERRMISDRTKAGLQQARRNGKTLGRPKVILDAAEVARLKAEGLSFAAIAERLGVSTGTAYNIYKAGQLAA
jgi:DNA invertase Pin-like site-specific DNA recombinase